MTNILYIKSSITGDNSQTNQVLDALHQKWTQKHPDAVHNVRDLTADPLPHLAPEHLAQAPAKGAQALAELKSADVLVVAAPMYNFSVPSTLKAWIDHVAKAGETFKYTETGPVGLLKAKRAVLVVGTGGVYSQGPAAAADFVVPFLKTVLGFMGIPQVDVVRVEGVALGASTKDAALAQVAAL